MTSAARWIFRFFCTNRPIAKFHNIVTAPWQLLKQLRHFVWFISIFEFAADVGLRDLLNFVLQRSPNTKIARLKW